MYDYTYLDIITKINMYTVQCVFPTLSTKLTTKIFYQNIVTQKYK